MSVADIWDSVSVISYTDRPMTCGGEDMYRGQQLEETEDIAEGWGNDQRDKAMMIIIG